MARNPRYYNELARFRLLYEGIAWRLKIARLEVYPDLTQREFAALLGMKPSAYNLIESGQRSLSTAALWTAGNKLQTGVDYLLYGSMLGVEPELRQKLLAKHPALREAALAAPWFHPTVQPDPDPPTPDAAPVGMDRGNK